MQPFAQLFQFGDPFRFDSFGYLAGHFSRRGTGPSGVGEYVYESRVEFLHKLVTLPEKFLAFSRQSRHQVYSKKHTSLSRRFQSFSYRPDLLRKESGVIMPAHSLEKRVASALKRYVEMRLKFGLSACYPINYIIGKQVGLY